MSEVDPLDLSNLQMLPDWVTQPQEKPKFKEEPVRKPGGKGFGKGGGKGFGGGGGDRRGGPPRGRRDDGQRGPGGGPGGRGRRDNKQGSGQGRGNDNRRGGGGDRRRGGGGQRRDQRGDGRPQQDPLPKDISLFFQPAQDGVSFIVQQIKTSGCAYPVFDLARLILNNRDRYSLVFESKGERKLYLCKLDGSLWMDRAEAVAHATSCKEFADYYKEEEVAVEAPKGNFSSIAVCGLSGRLLGPPNHHSYQENIVRTHAEQFSRMHIDGYKRKIRMERGDEIVEKWKEQQSTQSQFTVLKGEEGAEPVTLKNRQEAIRHFSQHFATDLIKEVKRATVAGDIAGRQLARPLFNLLVQEGERLRKFPMDLVQRLCRAFEKQGLKFFKEGKKTTYVARLRPRQITNEEKFSDGIRKIVSYVRSHPNTKLNDLAGALIPESKRSAPPAAKKKSKRRPRKKNRNRNRRSKVTRAFTIWALPYTPAPSEKKEAAESPPAADSSPGSGAFTVWVKSIQDSTREPSAPEEVKPEPAAPAVEATKAFSIWALPYQAAPASPKPATESGKQAAATTLTPEEIAVLQDLRWLIREGYVIEFSNGTLKLPRAHEAPKKKSAKKKVAVKQAAGQESAGGTAPKAGGQPPAQSLPLRKPDPTPTSAPPRA